MLLTKEVEMTWTHANKKYFIEKGYNFTKYYDSFMCKVDDLNKSSEKIIEYTCDYCGIHDTKSYKNYNRGKQFDVDKDACSHCAAKKSHEIRRKNGKEKIRESSHNITKKELFIEKLHKKAIEKSYVLLPYVYKNANQKMMYICNKHPQLGIQNATAFNISEDKCQCRGCIYDNASKARIFDIDTVRNIIEKNGKNKLLSNHYTNANERDLSITCALCNNPYTTSLQKFQERNQIICPSCRKKISFGENAAHWKGGISSLNSFLRCSIKPWIHDSLENSHYKCDISKKHGYLEVHHLHKNFKDIVDETLKITNLDIRKGIGEYTQDELGLLSNTCLSLHYEYGLGVCILREYHLEFHDFYGRFNNTPEQYYEFKKEIQSELFNDDQSTDSLLLCANE